MPKNNRYSILNPFSFHQGNKVDISKFSAIHFVQTTSRPIYQLVYNKYEILPTLFHFHIPWSGTLEGILWKHQNIHLSTQPASRWINASRYLIELLNICTVPKGWLTSTSYVKTITNKQWLGESNYIWWGIIHSAKRGKILQEKPVWTIANESMAANLSVLLKNGKTKLCKSPWAGINVNIINFCVTISHDIGGFLCFNVYH